jgi:hypothetical protein
MFSRELRGLLPRSRVVTCVGLAWSQLPFRCMISTAVKAGPGLDFRHLQASMGHTDKSWLALSFAFFLFLRYRLYPLIDFEQEIYLCCSMLES